MSGVRILNVLKDWWKFIQIHQNYTMALILLKENNDNYAKIYVIIRVRFLCNLTLFLMRKKNLIKKKKKNNLI